MVSQGEGWGKGYINNPHSSKGTGKGSFRIRLAFAVLLAHGVLSAFGLQYSALQRVVDERIITSPEFTPLQKARDQLSSSETGYGLGNTSAYVEVASRVWLPIPNTEWCHRQDVGEGLIYVKIAKASSSTCAGVNIRIARKVAERSTARRNSTSVSSDSSNGDTCRHTFSHGREEMLNKTRHGILWTFLRDPMKRSLSQFYHFQVSRGFTKATTGKTIRSMRKMRSFQFSYISSKPRNNYTSEELFDAIQATIMSQFDFIGLVERMDESLAVMKILWGLETSDLVVLNSKRSGGYDDGQFRNKCWKILKPENLDETVQHYVDVEFPQDNYDYPLYDVVNRSLDKTIEALGVDRVNDEIRAFRAAKALAEQECLATAIFPCSKDGTRQIEESSKNCYTSDKGCGYQCVDRVLQDKSRPS